MKEFDLSPEGFVRTDDNGIIDFSNKVFELNCIVTEIKELNNRPCDKVFDVYPKPHKFI